MVRVAAQLCACDDAREVTCTLQHVVQVQLRLGEGQGAVEGHEQAADEGVGGGGAGGSCSHIALHCTAHSLHVLQR